MRRTGQSRSWAPERRSSHAPEWGVHRSYSQILAFITTAQPGILSRILESIHVEPVPSPARGPPRWLLAQRMAAEAVQAGPQDGPADRDVYQPAPADEVYGIDVEYPD